MATPLTLDSACRDDGTFVLVVAGEIDMSNVEEFSEALTAGIAECGGIGPRLTVDLSAVKYLDSTAISALFSRADRIDIVAHPYLMGVFRISGLTELVSIEPASLSTESAPD
ncbi:STAS domain-containing protein [Mycolicibacterium sp. CBMA 226]|uniref:STAS domain-containing protein n=1 Tax=Mycolicibacterium sp. CBMA 226 TaxID=2606611 RepID=UPI0012DF7A61|nr:STAS domain-containing protein [Mycolicibacterium sp. CBMA 226]MUL79610.1 STAS domain-containing protein [Mycolicibacterium sp. CBMA 226]